MRAVTKDDFDMIYDIYMDDDVNPFMMHEKCTKKDFRPIFDEIYNRCYSWIYQVDGEDVGMGSAVGDSGRASHVVKIRSIGLKKEYHGQGLGEKILMEIIDELVDEGFKRLFLHVEADNEKAISLYEKAGFEVEGVQKKYFKRAYEDHYVDDLVMAKIIED